MGPGQQMGWGGWWIFPIIMFIIMVIFCFLRLGRRGFKPPWMQGSDKNHHENADTEMPLEILKKRYAKGEITKKEFEQMKKDLGG